MENFTKFWSWIQTLPIWLRAIVLALIATLAFLASLSFVACGTTTRAITHNKAEGTTTTISITTSNTSPIEVNTSPNVQLK